MRRKFEIDSTLYDNISQPHSSIDFKNILLDADKEPMSVRSVFRSANILTCLSHGVNSITDIAAYCKLNKATVYRLLKALRESRLAMMDPVNHRYYLGYSIAQIVSNPYTTHEYLITCALSEMGRLANITGESIILSILIGIQYVILHEITSKQELRVVGHDRPLKDIATGSVAIVLISQLESSKLNIALDNLDSEQIEGSESESRRRFVSKLKQVQRQGYAISEGEVIKGTICMSAPIKNYILPAAISILGPDNRMKPESEKYVQEIKAAALNIENKIIRAFGATNNSGIP
jgi:DNA-binding IclR family transcriptional regulator